MTRPLSTGRGVLRQALAISVLGHVALVGLARLPRPPEIAPAPAVLPTAEPALSTDVWAGTSPLPGAEGVVDVEVEREATGYRLQATGPEPEPTRAAAPAPAPSADGIEPPKPKPTVSAERRKPIAKPAASGSPEAWSPKPGASAGGEASGGSGGEFGAEGPGGVRDLGRAFTRAIPPGSDSDRAWAKLAVGDAGKLEITIDVDEEGKIADWRPNEKDPPAHLVNMVKRTIALLRAGTFAVRSGAVGGGSQVVELRARVSDVPVPEDHADAPFDLKWTFVAGKGTASFTQMGGRHVEVTVKVLRVETKG